jgi:hypothetical protein
MLPAMPRRTDPIPWVAYDPLEDRATLTLARADDVDAGQPLPGLQVFFDHHQPGRLLTVHTVGAATVQPRVWRNIVVELLGPGLSQALTRIEQTAAPLDHAPLEVPEPSEGASARQWRHAELRRRLGDPLPLVTDEPRAGWPQRLPAWILGHLTPATARNDPATRSAHVNVDLNLDPTLAERLGISNAVAVAADAHTLTVTVTTHPHTPLPPLHAILLTPTPASVAFTSTDDPRRHRAHLSLPDLTTPLTDQLPNLHLALHTDPSGHDG